MKKKTHKKYIKEIENSNFICIETYRFSSIPINHKCKKCNYIWKVKPQYILNNAKCPNCEQKKEFNLDNETYQKRLLSHKSNIINLEKYINMKTKILHKCNECEFEWDVKPINILKSNICPNCTKESKYINDIKNTNFLLIEKYINMNTKVNHKCKKCNYIWMSTPNNILKIINCPKCVIRRPAFNTEEYKEQIKNLPILCLEEYKNAHTKILHKCKKCNYEWKVQPCSIKNKSGCPKCSKNKTSYERYKDMPTTLYYIFIPKHNVYKIGLTQSSVKRRYAQEAFNYEILDEILFEDGYQAYLLEQGIIEETQEYLWNPLNEDKFIGWTECFIKDIL